MVKIFDPTKLTFTANQSLEIPDPTHLTFEENRAKRGVDFAANSRSHAWTPNENSSRSASPSKASKPSTASDSAPSHKKEYGSAGKFLRDTYNFSKSPAEIAGALIFTPLVLVLSFGLLVQDAIGKR